MNDWTPPVWISTFGDDELHFLKRFLLASGSLKQLAEVYGVSYPTIRGRLDRLIERVNAIEAPTRSDSFEQLLEMLVEQGIMVSGTSRALLQTHKRALRDVAERAARGGSAIPPEGVPPEK